MKSIILIFLFAFSLFAKVGYISAIRGDVQISRNGNIFLANKFDEIEEKDIFTTGHNSKAQIIFNDKTVVRIGRETNFHIEKYIFDKTKKSKFVAKVSNGFFSVVTGEIGKIAKHNFEFHAKTASIGIRGTHFEGFVSDKKEEISCLSGEISVKTAFENIILSAGENLEIIENDLKRDVQKIQFRDLEPIYNELKVEEKIDFIFDVRHNQYSQSLAIGNAYESLKEIENDELDAKFSIATVETNFQTQKDYFGFSDITGDFSQFSLANFGFIENRDRAWFESENYGNILNYENSILKYSGISIFNDEVVGNSEFFIDYSNKTFSAEITKGDEKFSFVSVNYLTPFMLHQIEKEKNPSFILSENMNQNGEFFDIYGFFLGENGEELIGEASITTVENEYLYPLFVLKKDEILNPEKIEIGKDNDFSWGYWAFENFERGSWFETELEVTTADDIQNLFQKSVTATYSGKVFGTVESDFGESSKFTDGTFNLKTDFSEKSISGEFKIENEIVPVFGNFEDSQIEISGENFSGTGNFYESDASKIAGGFNYISEEKLFLGSFVGEKE